MWTPLGISTQQVFEPSGEKAAEREMVMHDTQVAITNMQLNQESKWVNKESKRASFSRT